MYSINPKEFAEQQRILTGRLTLNQLARLIAEHGVQPQSENLHYNISFAKNSGTIIAEGELNTTVTLECQRCTELFTQPINTKFKLSIGNLSSLQTNRIEDFDTAVVDPEGMLDLTQILEDELLLEIPQFPKHNTDLPVSNGQMQECQVKLDYVGDQEASEQTNPFVKFVQRDHKN